MALVYGNPNGSVHAQWYDDGTDDSWDPIGGGAKSSFMPGYAWDGVDTYNIEDVRRRKEQLARGERD